MKSSTSKLRWGFPLLGAILWLATASLASADFYVRYIDPYLNPNEGYSAVVYWAPGFDVDNPVYTGISNEIATLNGGEFYSTSLPGLNATVTAFMLEDRVTGQVSDFVTVGFSTRDDPSGLHPSIAHVDISFWSDSDGEAPIFRDLSLLSLVEDGSLQLLNGFFVDSHEIPTNLPENITISVQSDASVPEPASLLLLGTGLIGLVGWRFRSTKKTVA